VLEVFFDIPKIPSQSYFWSYRSNNQLSPMTSKSEIDMIESPTILTPASAQAEDARQAGAESLNGNGFYRFKIGDFQATVISDGYGRFQSGRSSP
jgi:hypothetical protein